MSTGVEAHGEKRKVNAQAKPVFTIGHSNHEPGAFAALLRQHGVDVVVDVRSAPYSRYLPHFNKEFLEETLRRAGIGYVFKGQELGGQPAERALYDDGGRVSYERLADTAAFKEGMTYVLGAAAVHPSTGSGRTAAGNAAGSGRTAASPAAGPARTAVDGAARPGSTAEDARVGSGRTAADTATGSGRADGSAAGGMTLMCSEKEPLECHRTLLIGQALAERGAAVAHIHADGSLESHADAMNRLLDSFKLPHHGDLFRSREAVLEDAVARQARRVGARWRDPSGGGEWERAP